MKFGKVAIALLSGSQEGFSLIEVLVSMLLIVIMGLAVASNTAGALRVAKYTELNHAASSLAISKVEELAAIDAVDLNSSFDQIEEDVEWPELNITFTRTTTITVNADGSRRVDVNVTSNASTMPTSVDFATTFALWE